MIEYTTDTHKSDQRDFILTNFTRLRNSRIQRKFTTSAHQVNKIQKMQTIYRLTAMSILASGHDRDRYLHANLLTMVFRLIYGFMQFTWGVFTLVN